MKTAAVSIVALTAGFLLSMLFWFAAFYIALDEETAREWLLILERKREV